MAKLKASEINAMIDDPTYSAPEPKLPGKPKVIGEFDSQQEAADFVKSGLKLLGHGLTYGGSDEAIAALKTGSISSPEYKFERGKIRKSIDVAREATSPVGPLIEATGSGITDTLIGGGIPRRLLTAATQGALEAPEMSDVPSEALLSSGLQAGGELAGGLTNKLLFNDPTQIMTKSLGASLKQIEAPGEKSFKRVVERLDNAGFFKQGNVKVGALDQKFQRDLKGLGDLFQPQTLNSLKDRAEKSIKEISEVNKDLLKGKVISKNSLNKSLDMGIADLTYDPYGFNIEGKIELAEETKNIILSDLEKHKHIRPDGSVSAQGIVNAKKSLDEYMGSNAFLKKVSDLNITDEALSKFRTNLDELVDSVGGESYKRNNDFLSDLIVAKNTLEKKINRKYVDSGADRIPVSQYGLKDKFVNAVTPVSADIIRSDIAKPNKAMELSTSILKKVPSEIMTQNPEQGSEQKFTPMDSSVMPIRPGRYPNSVGISPMDMINWRIPRTTQGILENKDKVLAKIVQAGIPDQMTDHIAYALNGNPEDLANIAPLVMNQFPELFERSKYKTFDGMFMDPMDKAKAADSVSKDDTKNSIEKAKMISKINKHNQVPEGL